MSGFIDIFENYLLKLNFGHCNKYLELDDNDNDRISLSFKNGVYRAYGFNPHKFSIESKSALEIAIYLNKVPKLKSLIAQNNTLDPDYVNIQLMLKQQETIEKSLRTKQLQNKSTASIILGMLEGVVENLNNATIDAGGFRSRLVLSGINPTEFSKTCTMFCKEYTLKTNMVDTGKDWPEKEFPIMVMDAVLKYYQSKL